MPFYSFFLNSFLKFVFYNFMNLVDNVFVGFINAISLRYFLIFFIN